MFFFIFIFVFIFGNYLIKINFVLIDNKFVLAIAGISSLQFKFGVFFLVFFGDF